jgi:hypothetical protein
MRRTLTRALVAAGAVLALTGGPLLMAAAAQASVTRPASNLPWCDETGWCIAYQDEYTVGIVAVPGGDYSTYETHYTTSWLGTITVYVYEDTANGLCLGVGNTGAGAIVESACHDGLDQQFFINGAGYWQNAGASSGTGKAYVADSDHAGDLVEIVAQPSGSPNSHEQWIR